MKRIRYKKLDNKNVHVSNKILVSKKTGAQYLVYLDMENLSYKIKNIKTEDCYYGGENINNLNVLKRTVKARLKRMGVVFEDEDRYRTFGLCPKGYNQEIHEKKNYSI